MGPRVHNFRRGDTGFEGEDWEPRRARRGLTMDLKDYKRGWCGLEEDGAETGLELMETGWIYTAVLE